MIDKVERVTPPPNMFIYYYWLRDWWTTHRETEDGPNFNDFFNSLSNTEVWEYLDLGKDLYEEHQSGTTNT